MQDIPKNMLPKQHGQQVLTFWFNIVNMTLLPFSS